MADKNDGGDKTEKPTPKRLLDARKKGDVSKSREITSTLGLLGWLALGAGVAGWFGQRLAELCDGLFDRIALGWGGQGFAAAAALSGWEAAGLAVLVTGLLLVPIALLGLLSDFLQIGAVLTFEKVKPKLEHMNPAEGVKRMFSMDNLVEVLKAALKTALLFAIGWLVVRSFLPQIVAIARTADQGWQGMGELMWAITLRIGAWTLAVFAMVAALDAIYQRHSYIKKMRMSMRDIRQEMKDSEGDPHIKQQRKQAHAEWSQQNAAQAARGANALVVNPTHVAIAIDYDRETCPVPMIAAKGEGPVAKAMREAAEEAGVPIVRNVPLARDLLARGEIGELVPGDLFDVIAEVVLWARGARERMAEEAAAEGPDAGISPVADPATGGAAGGASSHPVTSAGRRTRPAPPGEDLSRYAHAPDVPGTQW